MLLNLSIRKKEDCGPALTGLAPFSALAKPMKIRCGHMQSSNFGV